MWCYQVVLSIRQHSVRDPQQKQNGRGNGNQEYRANAEKQMAFGQFVSSRLRLLWFHVTGLAKQNQQREKGMRN